jgi:CTD small phosphatase-like protein 2
MEEKVQSVGHSLSAIQVDYIESSQNYQGNYNNYVYGALHSMTGLTKLDYSTVIEANRIQLPAVYKKTLILDLDETLIHADFDNNYEGHDHFITFVHEKTHVTVPIFLRPGLFEFLEKVSQEFEIFVFTASQKVYADAVLNFLDPDGRIFKNRFYRDHCIKVGGKVFIKDLRIFVNRSLGDIVLVDNSLYSFTNQIENGVLINSFYNDKEDRELYNVLTYLENYLRGVKDVRQVNEKIFNFRSILEGFAMEPNIY